MPRVKFDYVVSFSSEDPDHPASNLLATEVSKKKWLCASGESSCSVVLGVSRAIRISSLTVGANMAALVEVLVGRSETPDEPFKVLVASSVFLNPIESRRGDAGGARVRSFPRDVLCEQTRDQTWDRVRVVCSQPYNRHTQFGLSFVHILSAEDIPIRPVPTLFSLEVQSDDEENFTPGELFNKLHTNRNTGSEIREATSKALKNVPQTSTQLVKSPIIKDSSKKTSGLVQNSSFTDRKRIDLMYTDEDATPNKKIDKVLENHERDKKRRDEEKDKYKEVKTKTPETSKTSKPEKRKLDDDKPDEMTKKHKFIDGKKERDNEFDDSKMERNHKHGNSKKERDSKHSDSKKERDNKYGDKNNKCRDINKERVNTNVSNKEKNKSDDSHGKDHKHKTRDKSLSLTSRSVAGPRSRSPHRLLSRVVFVLSGYQNPERAQLRDLAQAMGARYQPAWDKNATHLICAFPNTPKMREVLALSSSAATCTGAWLRAVSRRRRLLPWVWYHTDPRQREDHESDTQGEDSEDEASVQKSDDENPATNKNEDTDDEIERVLEQQRQRDRSSTVNTTLNALASREEEDTDDEIEKVKQKHKQNNTPSSPPEPHSDDGESTDTDVPSSRPVLRNTLPRPLGGVVVGVIGEGGQTVVRYLKAYGADIMDLNLDESEPDVIVSTDGSKRSGAAVCVTPDWVWECHRSGSKPDYEEYLLK